MTKITLAQKASNAALWRELDARLRERAALRQPGRPLLPLPMQATKDTFQRHDSEASLPADGKHEQTRNADLHLIWPGALGGPTVGWSLVPLPAFQHHDFLHPILGDNVRRSDERQREAAIPVDWVGEWRISRARSEATTLTY